jgi:hypothetical protein
MPLLGMILWPDTDFPEANLKKDGSSFDFHKSTSGTLYNLNDTEMELRTIPFVQSTIPGGEGLVYLLQMLLMFSGFVNSGTSI